MSRNLVDRHDPDRMPTAGRATRHKNQRVRLASRLVSQTEWLRDDLVLWTGEPETLTRINSAIVPLKAVLQDRLALFDAGLYAIRLSRPEQPQDGEERGRHRRNANPGLLVELRSAEAVTRELVAQTARAIEAVSKFPRAAARLVGPVGPWCERARRMLSDRRLALGGVEGWRAGDTRGCSLEARTIWLGMAKPPSETLPEPILASVAAGAAREDPAAAPLAAIALGRRRKLGSCIPGMIAWARVGGFLHRWPPSAAARIASDVGPDAVSAMAASQPALNSHVAAAWAEERVFDGAPVTAVEMMGLARLAVVVEAGRHEPVRRDQLLRELAGHYLQLRWMSWGITGPAARLIPTEVEERFRQLVLERVYGIAVTPRAASMFDPPGSLAALVNRWIGEPYFGESSVPYVDHLSSEASRALGRSIVPLFETCPTTLAELAPPGGPRDPAGAIAIGTAASRLSRMGAASAADALASWLEACRPLVPLASFWNDVLAVASPQREPSDAESARTHAASLESHAGRLAAGLACATDSRKRTLLSALPVVLSRGPDATDRVLRRDLWIERPESLDAALRFVEAAERDWTPAGPEADIPLPYDVFSCEDRALRDALLAFGLACWRARASGGRRIARVLELLAKAEAGTDSVAWRDLLPRLHGTGVAILRRIPADVDVADAAFIALAALDVCARWVAAGFEGSVRLGRVLADRWPSIYPAGQEWNCAAGDHNALIVRLSEGLVPRLLTLLRLPRASRRRAWRGADGFLLLSRHAVARDWISAALDRTELAARALRLLERVGLVARLDPAMRPSRLFAPIDGIVGPVPRWPPWVAVGDALMLEEIYRAGRVAGHSDDIPGPLRRMLDRESSMRREHEALEARARQRELSPAEQARTDRLAALLADPEALRRELRRSLARILPKHRALAGLAALEAIVSVELGRRWRDALGGSGVAPDDPAWDNALLMLESVSHNRRVLRRLLRHEARGDRAWIRELPPNQMFLARLVSAEVDAEAWLAPHSREVETADVTLTAYATTDPLEVLQMGSLFGTCLSADRFNAHAAVSAAVEVNKRVLYVRDRLGRVLGRQLLAITAAGEIIGFTSYGAGTKDPRHTGEWVRIALALLALDIARESGGRLMPADAMTDGLSAEQERSLSLFCTGYVDSPEPFDWWIEELSARGAGSGGDDRARLRALLLAPVPPGRDARTATGWRRDQLERESTRALMWLGSDAPDLEPAQRDALGLGARQANEHR